METDHMPASSDGLIADVNVTSFQTSIDDLLSAARFVYLFLPSCTER